MAEQWAAIAHQHPLWQEPNEQTAITTYCNLLEHRIQPRLAAHSITRLYIPRIADGDVNSWYPWVILLDAIIKGDVDTKDLQLLAQMIRCISRIPGPIDFDGEPVKSNVNAQVFWRDVPGFAYAFRQATPYILAEDVEDNRNSLTWEEATRKISNAHTFAAYYLRELDPDGPERDFASMRKTARDLFMWALEIKTESAGQIRRMELYIPTAAQWIGIAGRYLYKFCLENRDSEGEDVIQRWMGGPQHGSDLLWTGRDGFTIGRWDFWTERFGDIAALEGAMESVKTLAAQAMQEMKLIGSVE